MATDLIVLFALDREARPFRRRQPHVPVLLTGLGMERAAAAVDRALAQYKPNRVILAGFGGGLVPTLAIGDVIVAAEVLSEDGRSWPCEPPGMGRVLSVNRLIHSAAEKQSLGQRFQASVCDMESAAVAERCSRAGVPFSVVRAVSDTATEELSPTLGRLIAPKHPIAPHHLMPPNHLLTPSRLTTPNRSLAPNHLLSPNGLTTPNRLNAPNRLLAPDHLLAPDRMLAPDRLIIPDWLIASGGVSLSQVCRAFLSEPRLLGQFFRLARNSRKAARKLAHALIGMLSTPPNRRDR